jgi:hypothetical protein
MFETNPSLFLFPGVYSLGFSSVILSCLSSLPGSAHPYSAYSLYFVKTLLRFIAVIVTLISLHFLSRPHIVSYPHHYMQIQSRHVSAVLIHEDILIHIFYFWLNWILYRVLQRAPLTILFIVSFSRALGNTALVA